MKSKINLRLFLTLGSLLCALFLFSMCGDDDPFTPRPDPDPFTIEIDADKEYQAIAGFGGANRMWGTQFLKPAEAKKAFGLGEDELGLSIFRVRIASNKNEWPLIFESVKEARKYGVKIQASPWSPPASLKSNGSHVGGFLPEENYGAFVEHINAFIQVMKNEGVDIYAVSFQNEPDIEVSYESCSWRAIDMREFVRDYGDQITGSRLAVPESFNFNQDYTNTLLTDEDTRANMDIVAGHIYGGGLGKFPLAELHGKEIWMTEYLLNKNTGNSGAPAWDTYSEAEIWDETLVMLNTVHEAMMNNWNAYIWWYLQRYYSFIGDGEHGTTSGEILKRGYAFSHFSKFVRPGFIRVDATASETSDLQISAYTGDGQTVVVIINPEMAAELGVRINAPGAVNATTYLTNVDVDRQKKSFNVVGGKVTLDIPGKSVITIVLEN